MRTALVPLFLALSLSACNTASTAQSPAPAPTTTTAPTAPTAPTATEEQPAHATHSCPMHPEVTGMADSDCSKCGMKLMPAKAAEEAPKEAPVDEDHKAHDH